MLVYELPLNEVVFDFYDRLKSVSRGYASFDYQMIGYEENDLVKLSIFWSTPSRSTRSPLSSTARARKAAGGRCARS